jgi:hypothetical protein
MRSESARGHGRADPTWIGDTIYFTDRDGHFNIYAYNVSREDGAGHAQQTMGRALASADHEGRIVYEMTASASPRGR